MSVPGLDRVYRGKAPHYEVWFGKVDIAPGRAFWFRYSLLHGVQKEAAVWGILFDEGRVITGKETRPLAIFSTPAFRLGDSLIDEGEAAGVAGPISWNLRWVDRGRSFLHGPPLLNRLRLTKSRYSSGLLDLRCTGTIICEGRSIPVDGATGMVGHVEGSRQAHSWLWAHCNHFDNEPDCVFEGLAACLKIGGIVTRPLTSLVLFVGAKRYALSSCRQAFRSRSDWDGNRWRFESRSGDVRLRGEATAAGKTALIQYTDTDGSPLWCHNSKLASLKLHLTDPARGIDREFKASETAAFEWVDRERPERETDL